MTQAGFVANRGVSSDAAPHATQHPGPPTTTVGRLPVSETSHRHTKTVAGPTLLAVVQRGSAQRAATIGFDANAIVRRPWRADESVRGIGIAPRCQLEMPVA